MKNSYISELSGLMRRPYTLIKINFQRIRRLFWQVYLETLWNSANLPKNHMLATGFKADYDKT